jgi:hypothetical protein
MKNVLFSHSYSQMFTFSSDCNILVHLVQKVTICWTEQTYQSVCTLSMHDRMNFFSCLPYVSTHAETWRHMQIEYRIAQKQFRKFMNLFNKAHVEYWLMTSLHLLWWWFHIYSWFIWHCFQHFYYHLPTAFKHSQFIWQTFHYQCLMTSVLSFDSLHTGFLQLMSYHFIITLWNSYLQHIAR